MSQFWSPKVSRLFPYVPGEQPAIENIVKLNTNENPYGPSPTVLAAIRNESETLRLYPDPTSTRLREAIAGLYGLQVEQVFAGNGSDEVLAHVFHGLLDHDEPTLFPDITYSFFPSFCALYGIRYRTVPVGDSFEINVDAYEGPSGGIIIANPNAPTGLALGLDAVARLAEANSHCAVVIDEAYVDFGCESAVRLLPRFPNLLVVQTLSKSRSLAGLRVGFALGQPALIEALVRIKDSFNSYPLDRLAIAGGSAAIEDREWFEMTRTAVMRSRTSMSGALESLGFQVIPSSTNFVFARHPQMGGADLAAALRRRRVIVRHFARPRIDAFVRITVGTDAQCEVLLGAVRDILGEGASAPKSR